MTFRTSFIVALMLNALILAALAYSVTASRPGPQPAAQCYDLFEGLCRW